MKNTSESRAHARTLAVLAAIIFSASSVAVGNEVSAAPALDLVQVGLQTSMNHPYRYSLTAYNTSGFQVVSYQSSFPAAAFQLPSGTYLLTASAYYQNSTYCLQCVYPATASSPAASGSASGNAASPLIRPYSPPITEYGYSVTQVNGPTSIAISLKNASALPLTQLTVHVGYVNGTAVAGASVSGFVVGSYYVYSSKVTSYGQTDKSGDVTLTMPEAPVDVNAFLSVPIKLPRNTTTVTVNVGGQKVNVTVYLQPSFLNLNGEALILPPQTSASILLHYQPNSYPLVYNGAAAVATSGALAPSVTTSQSNQQALALANQTQVATRIAPFNPGGSLVASAGTTSGGSNATQVGTSAWELVIDLAAIGGALVVAVAVYALFMKRSHTGAPPL